MGGPARLVAGSRSVRSTCVCVYTHTQVDLTDRDSATNRAGPPTSQLAHCKLLTIMLAYPPVDQPTTRHFRRYDTNKCRRNMKNCYFFWVVLVVLSIDFDICETMWKFIDPYLWVVCHRFYRSYYTTIPKIVLCKHDKCHKRTEPESLDFDCMQPKQSVYKYGKNNLTTCTVTSYSVFIGIVIYLFGLK